MTTDTAGSRPLADEGKPGGLRDYLAIARLDHGTKHVFIVPGIALAWLLRGDSHFVPVSLLFGLVAAICIASANYVINEWLDRDFDRHHPTKSSRSSVQRELRGGIVDLEWMSFIVVGLISASLASITMFAIACVFAIQGIIYNVAPIRTKNKAYLDVISESINNPLRLMIGWAMIDPTSLPPSSIILAYWLGGAFLMAAKRLSEHREIVGANGKELLVRYRASFAGYTEESLTISCFVYAMLSSFFLAIFLIKYRVEYIIVVPAITALFAVYLGLSMKPGSSAQKPEKLFRERQLIALVLLVALLFAFATNVDLPWLSGLAEQHFIQLQ